MNLTHYFKRQHPMPGLNGIEKIAAIYIGITLVLTAIFYPDIEETTLFSIISGRVAVIIGTSLLLWLYKRYPCHATYHLRVLFQVALLAYWYPDIYNIAAQMPSQDHILAIADQAIFGCQPSVVFSQTLSGTFWNELFNMGYFSYYLMIAAVVFLAIVKRPRKFDKTTFVLMSTFFMYYTVFLLFNSAGPQFYFSCPGVDVSHGEFPPVDSWFRDHNTLNHMSDVTGPFSYLIHLVQAGEKPIAAFPSSHVGASTIILYLTLRMKKKWGVIMLPFWVILCLSTVYIGAHYAIDVVGGLLSALLFVTIANKLYATKFFHRPQGFDELHRFGHHHQHHRHRK